MIPRGIPDPKALVKSIRHKLSLFAFGLRLAFKSTCIYFRLKPYPVTVRRTPYGFNYAAPRPPPPPRPGHTALGSGLLKSSGPYD